MNTKTVLAYIDSVLARAKELKEAARGKHAGESERDFQEALGSCSDAIRQYSPAGSQYLGQVESILSNGVHSPNGTPNWWVVQGLEGILQSLRSGYETGRLQPKEPDIPGFLRLERILGRFHQVAKQLQKRHAGKDTLRIMDEYDVQDLLHALLKIDFNDIRAEEWTPSYAGKSARMDFLL